MNEASVWFLYMIRAADNSLYTGITKDVSRRFREHCSTAEATSNKGAKALRGKQPLKLEFCYQVGNRSEALKIEHKVKRLSKNVKENLVSGAQSIDELP